MAMRHVIIRIVILSIFIFRPAQATGVDSTYEPNQAHFVARDFPALSTLSRFDNTSWTNPFSSLDGDVMTLATHGDILYAGGFFKTAGGQVVNHVAVWKENGWSSVGGGMDHIVYALAVGHDGMLYAGGMFSRAGDHDAAFIARWDGKMWEEVGGGMNSIVQTLHIASDGSLYAGGGFTSAGGRDAQFIARWDGDRWSNVGLGMNHNVTSLVTSRDGTLYAGGGFTTAGSAAANQIARWDGSEWHAMGSGMNLAWFGRPVWALAIAPNGDLFAGGNFDLAGHATAANIARWDGYRWNRVGDGLNGNVHALLFDGEGRLYAGGYFEASGGTPINRVGVWAGRQWRALGSGVGDLVHALAISPSGVLHVGGAFLSAGALQASHLACWNTAHGASAVSVFSPDRMENRTTVRVFPIPSDRVTTLRVHLSETAIVRIRIYDVAGRIVGTPINEWVPAGSTNYEITTEHWPTGLYLYDAQFDESRQSGVILLVR